MSLFNNKKGLDLMHSTIIFIVLNLIFFLAMFAFVARTGSNAAIYEQIYAKEIALAIDQARPGTTISIFYGQEADIKIVQSDILVDRLADCFINQGEFVDVGNVFEDSNLNKE